MASAGTAEPDLTGYLPRHSAIVAGVDFNALQDHPAGKDIFEQFSRLTGVPVSGLRNIIFASDPQWKKRVFIANFYRSSTVDRMCGRLEAKKNASESDGDFDVYWLNGKPDERKFFRMIRLDDKVAGFYNGYPGREKFTLDRSGIAPEIKNKLPMRSSVMLWCVGFPESTSKYIKEIQRFDLTVESGWDGNMYLHGNVFFSNEFHAVLADWFFEEIVVSLLYRKFKIPKKRTEEAMKAIRIVRKKNVVRFSSREIPAVMPVITDIIKSQLHDYQSVMN